MPNLDELRYPEERVPEGYMMVRGLAVPKEQIDAVEQMYGAKYIDETTIQNRALIARLDEELHKFILANGFEPEFVQFVDIPSTFFKHMPLTSALSNIRVPINNKPAWFKFTRKHMGVQLPH